SEGAKFWLHVLTELKNRGVRDIFIGCVDGLKGFPQAIEAVFPATQVQLCLVHTARASGVYAMDLYKQTFQTILFQDDAIAVFLLSDSRPGVLHFLHRWLPRPRLRNRFE